MADALADIVAPRLDVLFCGINPGLLAAATGHHFAGHSNRFWRVLHQAGFTPEQLTPEEDHRLLDYGCGLTTVVARATAGADQLTRKDFAAAAAGFEHKIKSLSPRFVAFLGKPAYLALSGQRDATWGRQAAMIGTSAVWLLPNPSGRNLAFTLDALVARYSELHRALRA